MKRGPSNPSSDSQSHWRTDVPSMPPCLVAKNIHEQRLMSSVVLPSRRGTRVFVPVSSEPTASARPLEVLILSPSSCIILGKSLDREPQFPGLESGTNNTASVVKFARQNDLKATGRLSGSMKVAKLVKIVPCTPPTCPNTSAILMDS